VLRKGRCSNEPTRCTLAGAKTELPYAGIDSVCPECGSPLAAIAATEVPASEPISPRGLSTSLQSEPARPASARSNRYQPQATDRPIGKDGAMKFSQMAIIGAVIALLGFFLWRFVLQPRPVTIPDLASTESFEGADNVQVTQISPAQLRRVSVATEARSVPDAAGPIVAQLPAGSVLDVSGRVEAGGIMWLRVSLPNDGSRSGFVREDQMANLGDDALSTSPIDPLAGTLIPPNEVPGTVAPEIVGPIQARVPSTFYIASQQATIRQEASLASPKVGALAFTDPITIVAQRTVGIATWYQVLLPNIGLGWINGRFLSTTPRETPIDAPPIVSSPPGSKPDIVPPTSATELSETGKADNQSALTALGPGATLRVDASIANIRKEAGATGNSIAEVLQRDTLMTIEDVRIVNGVPWYRVTSPSGAQGWVSGRTVVENK
jgi:hypothetical protein